MAVRKAGRTTDYTQSMITLLNATVNVGYVTVRGPRTARFTGQIIAQPFSQGGDSGVAGGRRRGEQSRRAVVRRVGHGDDLHAYRCRAGGAQRDVLAARHNLRRVQ
ncbi:MAG: hypothetical protein HND48_02265 [Chloroflexi bacterium]|nr:hypothetical protein [Chloroflexota bacterium]